MSALLKQAETLMRRVMQTSILLRFAYLLVALVSVALAIQINAPLEFILAALAIIRMSQFVIGITGDGKSR